VTEPGQGKANERKPGPQGKGPRKQGEKKEGYHLLKRKTFDAFNTWSSKNERIGKDPDWGGRGGLPGRDLTRKKERVKVPPPRVRKKRLGHLNIEGVFRTERDGHGRNGARGAYEKKGSRKGKRGGPPRVSKQKTTAQMFHGVRRGKNNWWEPGLIHHGYEGGDQIVIQMLSKIRGRGLQINSLIKAWRERKDCA